MNNLKQTLKIFFLAVFVGLTNSSCQEKYPDLENGIYAEFITNQGIMVARLHYDKTPVTVGNFVSLAEGTNTKVDAKYTGKKFYDSLIFHRVIDKFMIQGGDPLGTGTGSPGYRFKDEFHPDLKHDKPGILSMANSGPTTNGSQFFITEVPTPHLNNKHSVFGELVIGLDIQDKISNVKAQGSKPIDPVIINKLNIIRKGKEAKDFNAVKIFDEHFIEVEKEKKRKEELMNVAREDFIKTNKNLKGKVKKMPSGIVLIYTKEGDGKGKQPTAQDKVLVDYAGYLIDGTLFDTNIPKIAKENDKFNDKRTYAPLEVQYNSRARLIPGFREAVLNMKINDKVRVFIPSFLGYGERGTGPIKPNSNLVFDLELVGIKK